MHRRVVWPPWATFCGVGVGGTGAPWSWDSGDVTCPGCLRIMADQVEDALARSPVDGWTATRGIERGPGEPDEDLRTRVYRALANLDR